MSKKKETIINFIVGFLGQFIVLVFGLVVPKIILTHYGSDTNGLLTSIAQIFTYVALLESGIGLATRNALFKPLNDKNYDDVNAILSSSRHYYHIASLFYAIIVVILSIVLPFILNTDVDYWTIFFVVLFEGMASAFSFYFIDVDICFLNTVGRTYIVNIIETAYRLIGFIIKVILALNGVNITYLQIGYFMTIVIKMILIKVYMKRKYPEIKQVKGKAPIVFSDRKYYLITEVAWVIFSSTDVIILSIFLSTRVSSVYSVYNMIFMSISTVINSIYSALSYNLGEYYHKDIEKYKKIHNMFNSFVMTITTILVTTAFWLTLPFVKLYTQGVEDVNYYYRYLPLLFSLVQMLSWSRYVSGNLTSVAGYAKNISVVSTIEAFLNISISIVLVLVLPQEYGIYGVLIATICALPLKVFITNFYSEKIILKRKPFKTLAILFANYGIFAISVVLEQYIVVEIANYWQFILYGFVFVIIYSVVVVGVNFFVNRDLKDLVTLFKR